MDTKQTGELLKYIEGAFPGRFDGNKNVLRVWSEEMADQDFDGVMFRARRHIAKSPHPPTIADLKKIKPPVIG